MSGSDYQRVWSRASRLRKAGPRGRYAPSPTGPLHLGNARTALAAWLQARLTGGVFILRMEDLDTQRVREGSARQILDDLRWLGLDWDEGPDVGGPVGPYVQSMRTLLYEHAIHELIKAERVFPCYCSRKDVVLAASAPHGGGVGIYPGTCHDLPPDVVPPRPPAWRYRVPAETIQFTDKVAGVVSQALHSEVGDFVVRRADSLFAYQLAVVVDDALMGMTDVVRGADLLESTARQIELFRALGLAAPDFWHVPLLHDAQGRRMSKRGGSDSLAVLRERGFSKSALVGRLAASLGLVPEGVEVSATELLYELDEERLRRSLVDALRRRES